MKKMMDQLNGKRILIWGYGREGKSTERFLRTHASPARVDIFEGKEADVRYEDYDVVIKSPGIPVETYHEKLTSQTEIFLDAFRDRTVGITGTKGKSTTSTLLYTVLRDHLPKKALLVGNIGLPCLDFYDEIDSDTVVVFEMSCHQLNHCRYSPHIAVFLNLFEDHLDYYGTMDRYFAAKENITLHQTEDDFFFAGNEVPEIATKARKTVLSAEDAVDFDLKIPGAHNRYNARFVYEIATKCFGISGKDAAESMATFTGLKHRLEYVATVGDVRFYDDSISTIPEATIRAAESIPDVGTVLVGGMDRGIEYDALVSFIREHPEIRFILSYASGERIFRKVNGLPNAEYLPDLPATVKRAKEITPGGKAVVLSPAAASYGYFKNFEERGDIFAALAKEEDPETVSFVFTGDIGFDRYMEGRWQDPELLDPTVKAFLHSGDHVVANVEGALVDPKAEATADGPKEFHHGMPADVSAFLKDIHADVWNFNNNHIMDFGDAGLFSSLRTARESGATPIGVGRNIDEAAVPALFPEAGGVGLVSVGYQRGCKAAGPEKAGCLPWNDMDRIGRVIREIKARCRWCVVVSHGGEEFTALPSPYTRDRYLAYLDMGADAVVSHHPHVPMNYEKVGEKLIFYSLGNFIFDTDYQRNEPYTDIGLLLKLTFTREKMGFTPFPVKIDRKTERILPGELPAIFTDVPAEEYELLIPLATKMFLAATKRQWIYMKPDKFKNATEEEWIADFLDPNRPGRVAGEGLDFILLLPIAEKEQEKAWEKSALDGVKGYILSQM